MPDAAITQVTHLRFRAILACAREAVGIPLIDDPGGAGIYAQVLLEDHAAALAAPDMRRLVARHGLAHLVRLEWSATEPALERAESPDPRWGMGCDPAPQFPRLPE